MPSLAHSFVRADGQTPEKWMLFLHGILGRGGNLRVIARRVVTARPRWGIVLVDLRMHGASQAFSAPHTVEQCAEDLLALDALVPGPIRGVLGHSFGGKVSLCYLARRPELEHVFTVDSSPSPRSVEAKDSPTREVIRFLGELPPSLPSREALIDRVVAAGLSRGLGEWLAMNLELRGDGWHLALDLVAIRALLESYFELDLWPLVESLPGGARMHFIVGERSRVYPPDDRARIERLAARAPERAEVHYLPTGHWVHVEDADGLVRVVTDAVD